MAGLGLLVLVGVFSVGFGCPNGWLTHSNKCYHFSRETETWLGATRMCEFMKGTLVEIETKDENDYLKQQARTIGHSFYWTALSDVEEEGTWNWMISKVSVTGDRFTDWMPGQPNNYQRAQECMALDGTHSYMWNDADCKTNYYYICEQSDSPTEVIG
ncbi:Collectin-12 [Mactra antiquata]